MILNLERDLERSDILDLQDWARKVSGKSRLTIEMDREFESGAWVWKDRRRKPVIHLGEKGCFSNKHTVVAAMGLLLHEIGHLMGNRFSGRTIHREFGAELWAIQMASKTGMEFVLRFMKSTMRRELCSPPMASFNQNLYRQVYILLHDHGIVG